MPQRPVPRPRIIFESITPPPELPLVAVTDTGVIGLMRHQQFEIVPHRGFLPELVEPCRIDRAGRRSSRENAHDRSGHACGISDRHQFPVAASSEDLRRPARAIGGDDRRAQGEGLDEHRGEGVES